MFLKLLYIVLYLSLYANVEAKTLLSVSDDELLQLIKDKEKLIVLFTKPSCDTCKQFEKHLENLQEDFNQQLKAETVKASNSHLARLYNPTKEPALVFFRHGIPLLYNGEPDENEIYPFFEQNQTPVVKELTDKIFEHITQAATGATTGDWFVMFYGASCVECQRLHAVWEGVGASLRGRVNVARIDANLAGANTARRFHVDKLPAFLFFRLGKVYNYDLPKTDIKTFVAFAQDWYRNAKGEPVPLLASPFDELIDWCVSYIRAWGAWGAGAVGRRPWLWQGAAAGFSLVALTALVALLKARRPRAADKKSK